MKILRTGLSAFIAIVMAGGISYATLYKWSQTAATNATADSTINWAEGMAPSAVNDSARAMMAATAKYRDDTSGKLVTGGTSTAYTLTSNQVFTSLSAMDGAELCFRPNATSGAAPTLAVDGLTAKALNQVSGTAIATGALLNGGVYCAVYDNSGSQFIVKNIAGSIPSGTSIISTLSSCPTGWTKGSTHNDKALRLVTGTPSTGGTNAFSTSLAGSTSSYTLQIADIPSHNHGGATGNQNQSHTHDAPLLNAGGAFAGGGIAGVIGYSGGASGVPTGTTSADHTHTISSQGGGGGHAHAIGVQYVDVILCQKD